MSRNGQALWRLGDIHRMQGNLDAARDLYQRLSESGPDRLKASWLSALLDGRGLPEAPPHGTCPAPFVRMKDFLTTPECDRLFALALARREHFGAARVGGQCGGSQPREAEGTNHPGAETTRTAGRQALVFAED